MSMTSFQAGLVICRIAELITEGSSSTRIRRQWDGSRSKRKEITGAVFDAGGDRKDSAFSGKFCIQPIIFVSRYLIRCLMYPNCAV